MNLWITINIFIIMYLHLGTWKMYVKYVFVMLVYKQL